MAAPMARQAKATGKQTGPKKWSRGERLWDTMCWHKHMKVITRYPLVVTSAPDGSSNDSLWSCLESTELYSSAESLATKLLGENCELYNSERVYVGVSMASGAIQHFNYMIVDGVAREFLHPTLLTKWKALWQKYDLEITSKQLNSQDYPSEPRDPESAKKAVRIFPVCQ